MEQLQQGLVSQLENPIAFDIPLFGGIPVAQSVVVSWVVMALAVALSAALTRRLDLRPGRGQVMLEWLVGGIDAFCRDALGPRGRAYAAWLGTVGIFLGLANLVGVLSLPPPTKDVNVTAALAITSTALIYGGQFRAHGLVGGLRRFAQPMGILLPINVLEIVIRPLSLCMRLFGNVLGSFVVMELMKHVLPVVAPAVLSIYFDLFDGLIQAIVFVFLTALFLADAVEEEDA